MKRHSLILAALMAALALTGCAENSPVNPGEGGFSTIDGSVGTGSTSDEPDNTLDEPSSTNKPGSTQNEPNITPNESSIISTNKPDNTPNESSITPTHNPHNTTTPTKPRDTATPTKPNVKPTQPKPPAQQDDTMIEYPHCSASELKAAIEKFPLDTITLPDGSSVSKYDAISANGPDLVFDFAFYRNASPIYKTTLDDPDLIRYEDGFWQPAVDLDSLDKEIDASYKKASKGDVLENGLSVRDAKCQINDRGGILNDIFFDGSITVPGMINYLPEEQAYISAGTLYFRPDTTKALIPKPYSSKIRVGQYWDGYGNGEDDPPFYMYYDGPAWVLGSINDSKYDKYDLKSAFGDKTTIPATVTVGNIKYPSLSHKSGEIIDIQI